jgi:hypothetical protein
MASTAICAYLEFLRSFKVKNFNKYNRRDFTTWDKTVTLCICVHIMYTSCTHQCTHHVHIIYTSCTHQCTHHVHISVHIMYTSCTHHVHIMYTSCTQQCTHHVHIMYTSCTDTKNDIWWHAGVTLSDWTWWCIPFIKKTFVLRCCKFIW